MLFSIRTFKFDLVDMKVKKCCDKEIEVYCPHFQVST